MTSTVKRAPYPVLDRTTSECKIDGHFVTTATGPKTPSAPSERPLFNPSAAISRTSPMRIEKTTHVQQSYSSMLDQTDKSATNKGQITTVPQTPSKKKLTNSKSGKLLNAIPVSSTPRYHADFDRGNTVNREAKLFDPKKDSVPMIRARQPPPGKHRDTAREEKATEKVNYHGSPKVRHKHRATESGLQIGREPRDAKASDKKAVASLSLRSHDQPRPASQYGELRLLQRESAVASGAVSSSKSTSDFHESSLIDSSGVQEDIMKVETALRSSIALVLRGSDTIKQSSTTLPRQVMSAYHELLELYVDLLIASQRSTSSESPSESHFKGLLNSMWSSAALLPYDLLDSVEPISSCVGVDVISEIRYSSLLHAYTIYALLATTIESRQRDWALSLERLSNLLFKTTRVDDAISSFRWKEVAEEWHELYSSENSSQAPI